MGFKIFPPQNCFWLLLFFIQYHFVFSDFINTPYYRNCQKRGVKKDPLSHILMHGQEMC